LSTLADMPHTLTVEETADLLRLGRSATYEAVRRGEIPSLKVGRRLLIPTARLAALLGERPEPDPTSSAAPSMGPEATQTTGKAVGDATTA
jgi:excisionase family DNA binding protein